MHQFSKFGFFIFFACVAFTSCSNEDRIEPNRSEQVSGDNITLNLSAEIGFEDEPAELKALNFKLEQVDGKNIPRPQFSDNQEVEVVTVIKNSDDDTYAKKMTWKYVAATRSLVLLRGYEGNNIIIPNFNNDGDVKWYIAGLIAPEATLSGTEVKFAGKSVLQAMTATNVANLNVPYWTGWIELFVESFAPNTRDGNGSYSNAKVQTTGHKFKPLGSLIAYKLGNKQTAGVYTFTPTGFIVSSNAFSDKGTFDFSTTSTTDANPKLMETKGAMTYTFASSHDAPGTIAHNGNADKTYYAWVMPYTTQPTTVRTRVLLKGTSSRSETPTYKDYTKTYYTDYTTVGKASGGKPVNGKVYTLRANATRRLALPIEYASEYNLAGGNGWTYTLSNISPQPDGVQGPLRFSNRTSANTVNSTPHDNDQSGYYNWYRLTGEYHGTSNNPLKNLQASDVRLIDTDGIERNLVDNYFVPELDHWWGVFPRKTTNWSDLNHPQVENFQLGYDEQLYFVAQSEYLPGTSSNNDSQDAFIYAIRFAAYSGAEESESFHGSGARTYQPLLDNSLRCAYRYTRVGGLSAWAHSNNQNLTSQMKIDVVYLGEEATPTSLSDIKESSWWSSRSSQIISRTFPVPGSVENSSANPAGSLSFRGFFTSYWSESAESQSSGLQVYLHCWDMYGRHGATKSVGFPVRLFRRNPEQP